MTCPVPANHFWSNKLDQKLLRDQGRLDGRKALLLAFLLPSNALAFDSGSAVPMMGCGDDPALVGGHPRWCPRYMVELDESRYLTQQQHCSLFIFINSSRLNGSPHSPPQPAIGIRLVGFLRAGVSAVRGNSMAQTALELMRDGPYGPAPFMPPGLDRWRAVDVSITPRSTEIHQNGYINFSGVTKEGGAELGGSRGAPVTFTDWIGPLVWSCPWLILVERAG